MSRPRAWTAGALVALVLAAGAAVTVWARRGPGHADAATSASQCRFGGPPPSSRAPIPASLSATLPVLARPRTAEDGVPREAGWVTASLGSGVELAQSRLVRTSADGGRAWVIPVLHESPQVRPNTACERVEIASLRDSEHLNAGNARARHVIATLQRRTVAAEQYLNAHSAPGPAGVVIFTKGEILQGGTATVDQLRGGSAFITGECAGPQHNLLSVSGLAPAGASTVRLRSPDGASQDQPVGDGAYSFLFAPDPSRAGLPDKLVLLDRDGHPLHTLRISPSSFSTHPQCQPPGAPATTPLRTHGLATVLPAGSTVIASGGHASGGTAYTIGVFSGGAPGCDPVVNTVLTGGSSSGGEPGNQPCTLSFAASSVIPTFGGGGCAPDQTQVYGSVSPRVRTLRFTAVDGRSVIARVAAVPRNIARSFGVVVAIGPSDILASNPTVQSLGAGGRVLATSHPLSSFAGCGTHRPVFQLGPGVVTLAHAHTPQGPVAISLDRIRFEGHQSLCITQRPQGNGQCARYPIGPQSNQNSGNAPVWLLPGGHGIVQGTCVRGDHGHHAAPGTDRVAAYAERPHADVDRGRAPVVQRARPTGLRRADQGTGHDRAAQRRRSDHLHQAGHEACPSGLLQRVESRHRQLAGGVRTRLPAAPGRRAGLRAGAGRRVMLATVLRARARREAPAKALVQGGCRIPRDRADVRVENSPRTNCRRSARRPPSTEQQRSELAVAQQHAHAGPLLAQAARGATAAPREHGRRARPHGRGRAARGSARARTARARTARARTART